MIFQPGYHYFLVGHRGVGKSTLLKQLQSKLAHFSLFDLDNEVAAQVGLDLSTFFTQFGEPQFRKAELLALQQILNTHLTDTIVALGAGFKLSEFQFPKNSRFILIGRKTDSMGRIFLDRPLWNDVAPPLEQYLERYKLREPLFDQFCDLYLELPEGFEFIDCSSALMKSSSVTLEAPELPELIVTLTQWHLAKESRLEVVTQIASIKYLEIRTDLISYGEYQEIQNQLTDKSLIFSIRSGEKAQTWPSSFFDQRGRLIDCDLEQVSNPDKSSFFIVSSHSDSTPQFDSKLKACYYKWSPILKSFDEWTRAMQWQELNPTQHILAPRVDDSWHEPKNCEWMRDVLLARQKLHYVRCDQLGSAQNQPHWLRFLLLSEFSSPIFYAVLGLPVEHSISPMFHLEWVKGQEGSFFKIPVQVNECELALNCLVSFGLRGAAITSPLKPLFITSKSINTFKIQNGSRAFANTDIIGLALSFKLIEQLGILKVSQLDRAELLDQIRLFDFNNLSLTATQSSLKILVFGGGGLLESLKALFPQADYLPVRAQLSEPPPTLALDYDILLWAAPPNARFQLPQLKISSVWDLNYHESSLARELALHKKTPYLSGHSLFMAQAIAQQKFWS